MRSPIRHTIIVLLLVLSGCMNRSPDNTAIATNTSNPVEATDGTVPTLSVSPTRDTVSPTLTPSFTASPFPTSEAIPGRILYSRGDGLSFIRSIHLMNADGSNQVSLIDHGYTSGAAWAPDGSKIALVGNYESYLEDNVDLYILDVRDTKLTRIFHQPDSMINGLDWSPDGQYLALVLTPPDDTNGDIFIISADGSTQIQVTNTPDSDEGYFDWSPDGKQIVYTRENGDDENIYVGNVDSDDFEPTQLTTTGGWNPIWSPDGSQIAFASNIGESDITGIHLMNADGSDIRLLIGDITRSPLPMATWDPALEDVPPPPSWFPDGSSMGHRWSPDGTRIAFRSYGYFLGSGYSYPYSRLALYVINADGTGLTNLSAPGDMMSFDWSPDGNWIAFTSHQETPYDMEAAGDIYLIHPDGTGLTRITDTPDETELNVLWQPDPH